MVLCLSAETPPSEQSLLSGQDFIKRRRPEARIQEEAPTIRHCAEKHVYNVVNESESGVGCHFPAAPVTGSRDSSV